MMIIVPRKRALRYRIIGEERAASAQLSGAHAHLGRRGPMGWSTGDIKGREAHRPERCKEPKLLQV